MRVGTKEGSNPDFTHERKSGDMETIHLAVQKDEKIATYPLVI